MSRSRLNTKGRHDSKPFLRLPREIVDSSQYADLNTYALKLLIDLFAQFRGSNNGDFCATWSVMEERGWKSRATLTKMTNQLLDAGFIVKTRQGGRNSCSLFAITWLPIDECDGKLDAMFAPINLASNKWKQ